MGSLQEIGRALFSFTDSVDKIRILKVFIAPVRTVEGVDLR